MFTLTRCMGCTAALFGLLLIGCSAGEAPTEPEIPAFALEGRWDGEFVYEYDEQHDWWYCTYDDPTDGIHYPFECGTLLLGLEAGVTPNDLQDLFQTIDARPGGYRDWGDKYSWMEVAVPMRTERTALLVASEVRKTRACATPR